MASTKCVPPHTHRIKQLANPSAQPLPCTEAKVSI